ncbi:MAG: hypothetical protein ACRD4K_01095 [Candidatus Acidiferrales bacterium]
MKSIIFAALLALAFSAAGAQEKNDQSKSDEHHCGVMKRGNQAMGFSHEKTTHHFLLADDGGSIEIQANDPKDIASQDQIREHLGHIVKRFAAGDFEIPMFIHATTPPGVPVMKTLRDQIQYGYEKMDRSARVRITTKNAEALDAIHDFLRFQISDHQSGDPAESGHTHHD